MSAIDRRQTGFTILELAIVLIVIGILAAALIPMSQRLFGTSMDKTDQKRLDAIQNALIGYARINQGLPCFNSVGQSTVPTVAAGCDSKVTLTQLGVRDTDARGQAFVYDVNPTLTTKYIQDHGQSMCASLGYLINPNAAAWPSLWPYGGGLPPLQPQVCAADATNMGTAACTTAATPTNPTAASMAFVLVGKGGDRCLNLEDTNADEPNNASCIAAATTNRVYENPAHAQHLGNDTAYYDDIVVDEPLSELAQELGCPAGGGSGSTAGLFCPSGKTLVNMVNGDKNNHAMSVAGSCYLVVSGTSGGAGCQPSGSTIRVYNSTTCGGGGGGATVTVGSGALTTILCDESGTCTAN